MTTIEEALEGSTPLAEKFRALEKLAVPFAGGHRCMRLRDLPRQRAEH